MVLLGTPRKSQGGFHKSLNTGRCSTSIWKTRALSSVNKGHERQPGMTSSAAIIPHLQLNSESPALGVGAHSPQPPGVADRDEQCLLLQADVTKAHQGLKVLPLHSNFALVVGGFVYVVAGYCAGFWLSLCMPQPSILGCPSRSLRVVSCPEVALETFV